MSEGTQAKGAREIVSFFLFKEKVASVHGSDDLNTASRPLNSKMSARRPKSKTSLGGAKRL